MSRTDGAARPAVAPVEEDPNAAVVAYSSPPCFLHELDPSFLGYLGQEEVAALVGALLATEWDGGGAAPDEAERRLRDALRRHLEGAAGDRTATMPRASAEPNGDRGPEELARTLRDALPRIHDDALRCVLGEVLGVLERGAASPRDGLRGGR